MINYFFKRLILAIIALFAIVTIVYFLMGLTKNSPIDPTAYPTQEAYEMALKDAGLDQPIGQRFLTYITDIFTNKGFGKIYGDVGAQSIPQLFFGPLKYTLWITLPAFFISIFLGVSLGFLAGYNRGRWIDAVVNIFVILFFGIPSFILAAIALAIGGAFDFPIAFIKPEDGGYKQMILSLIIPIIVMSLTSLAIYTYYTRNEVVSILSSNQVVIARAKGLDEWKVFKYHVIRNISIPLVSIILPSFPILLAGSMVIETFFQIPGSSSIIVNAISQAEYNIVMFNTIFFVSLGLVIGIIVDILYVFLDPRIKYSSAKELKIGLYWKAFRQRKINQKLGVSEKLKETKGAKGG